MTWLKNKIIEWLGIKTSETESEKEIIEMVAIHSTAAISKISGLVLDCSIETNKALKKIATAEEKFSKIATDQNNALHRAICINEKLDALLELLGLDIVIDRASQNPLPTIVQTRDANILQNSQEFISAVFKVEQMVNIKDRLLQEEIAFVKELKAEWKKNKPIC